MSETRPVFADGLHKDNEGPKVVDVKELFLLCDFLPGCDLDQRQREIFSQAAEVRTFRRQLCLKALLVERHFNAAPHVRA